MAKRQAKQNFLQGALILAAGLFLVKLLGALFKIPLTWLIGEDGLGYFNTAYHFYTPIHSLATAGFPIAIARLVSQYLAQGRYGDAAQVHRISRPVFCLTGCLGTVGMLVGSWFYVRAIGNPQALPAMLVLAPAILFGCFMAIYRGYYEGLHNMLPTAVSEVTEALSKLIFGLSGAFFVLQIGIRQYTATGTVFGTAAENTEMAKAILLPYAAAAAIGGVTLGTILGFVYLLWAGRGSRIGISLQQQIQSPPRQTKRETLRSLLRTALPIGLGALAINVAGLVDTTLLQMKIGQIMAQDPQALQAVFPGMIPAWNLENGTVPNYLYGCYSQAMTLFLAVPMVTQAFGTSSLPGVTAAWTSKDRAALQQNITTVLRMTGLLAIPAGLGMSMLASPVCALVFGARASTPITAQALTLLGIASIFAAISTPVQSMLQAVGRTDVPVKLLLIGLSVKTLLTYLLCGNPQWNLLGAGIGTISCYAILLAGGLWMLHRSTGIALHLWKTLGRAGVSAVLCCTAARLSYRFLCMATTATGATLGAIGVAMLLYLLCIWIFGILEKSDILLLPKGEKFVKLLEKIHVFG